MPRTLRYLINEFDASNTDQWVDPYPADSQNVYAIADITHRNSLELINAFNNASARAPLKLYIQQIINAPHDPDVNEIARLCITQIVDDEFRLKPWLVDFVGSDNLNYAVRRFGYITCVNGFSRGILTVFLRQLQAFMTDREQYASRFLYNKANELQRRCTQLLNLDSLAFRNIFSTQLRHAQIRNPIFASMTQLDNELRRCDNHQSPYKQTFRESIKKVLTHSQLLIAQPNVPTQDIHLALETSRQLVSIVNEENTESRQIILQQANLACQQLNHRAYTKRLAGYLMKAAGIAMMMIAGITALGAPITVGTIALAASGYGVYYLGGLLKKYGNRKAQTQAIHEQLTTAINTIDGETMPVATAGYQSLNEDNSSYTKKITDAFHKLRLWSDSHLLKEPATPAQFRLYRAR